MEEMERYKTEREISLEEMTDEMLVAEIEEVMKELDNVCTKCYDLGMKDEFSDLNKVYYIIRKKKESLLK